MPKGASFKYKRKKIIVFSFEGKNNKTESLYFSHFKPSDDNYILKTFSSGVTDPINMVKSTKNKRKKYDYNASEDITYIFIDGDDDSRKIELIKNIKKTLGKDVHIIVSNPTFETWFLNHFEKTTKSMSNSELLKELNKYINNYQKSNDYFDILDSKTDIAVKNSNYQISLNKDNPYTDTVKLIENKVIIKK